MNLLYGSGSPVNLDNVTACPGASTTLTPTGCSGGSLPWSNGSTSSSITVNPVTTTTYSVNLYTSLEFQFIKQCRISNLQQIWKDGTTGQAHAFTTTPADVYSGSKAVKLDGL
ncbi:MAG: hypothetical protein IPN49_09335 [Saprospiraceae bacterium]|nr:hypothetical protein [Saprospiraceae bacterium]